MKDIQHAFNTHSLMVLLFLVLGLLREGAVEVVPPVTQVGVEVVAPLQVVVEQGQQTVGCLMKTKQQQH